MTIDRHVYRDVPIDRPIIKDVIKEVVQTVPKIIYQDQYIQVPKIEFVTTVKQIEVPEIVSRTIYVDRPVYQDRIFIREKYKFTCAKCGHIHEEDKNPEVK